MCVEINSKNNNEINRLFEVLLGAISVETLITAIYLLSMSADPKNAVFLGYSARRLLVIGFVIAGAVIVAGGAWFISRYRPLWLKNIYGSLSGRKQLYWLVLGLSGLIFIVGWGISWTPAYQFRKIELIYKGLRPVIVLITVSSAEMLLLLFEVGFGIRWSRLKLIIKGDWKAIRNVLLIIGFIFFLWLFVVLTRIGTTPDVAYWNEPGVPLLAIQVFGAWLVTLLFFVFGLLFVNRRHEAVNRMQAFWNSAWNSRLDILICLVLWGGAMLLWVNEPQLRSFFAPSRRPPNQMFYPLSDAAGYDLSAQFALIGQGLENGHHVDKPLYSTFLVFLHLFAGQDFDQLVMLQSSVLALIAVVLYLMGKALHSRPAGVLAALLIGFKGRNAIAGSWMVLSSNPKMIMSEYPLALCLAVFTLFLLKWLKKPNGDYVYLIAAGGMLGLSTMIRHNVWVLVFFSFAIIWLTHKIDWKKSLRSSIVLFGVTVITIVPWMWRSIQETNSIFYFMPQLTRVIISDRYQVDTPSDGKDLAVESTATVISNEDIRQLTPTSLPLESTQMETPTPMASAAPRVLYSGTYDGVDTNIVYTGKWYVADNVDTYGGSLMVSSELGGMAEVRFSGSQVALLYMENQDYLGKCQVFIDDQLIDTIDMSSDKIAYQLVWQSPMLSSGNHVMQIKHTEGKLVGIDAVIVGPLPTSTAVPMPIFNQRNLDRVTGIVDTVERLGGEALAFVPGHTVHNWIASVLVFPLSLINDSLERTIMVPEGYWSAEWDGKVGFPAVILLGLNLFLLCIGIGMAWSRWRLAGFMPLFTFFFYHLGTGLARTSGGRYIVPVDWVLILYFALGLAQLTLWLSALFGFRPAMVETNQEEKITSQSEEGQRQWLKHIAVLGIFLFAGFTPLVADNVFERRYEDYSQEDLYQILVDREAVDKIEIDQEELERFLEDEELSFIRIGRILSPNYYQPGEGEPVKGSYSYRDFPRMVMRFIGPNMDRSYSLIMPISILPDDFPAGSDAIVIGCDESPANTLAIVILRDDGDIVYNRVPPTELICPFREPVCDGNGNCQ